MYFLNKELKLHRVKIFACLFSILLVLKPLEQNFMTEFKQKEELDNHTVQINDYFR